MFRKSSKQNPEMVMDARDIIKALYFIHFLTNKAPSKKFRN